MSKEATVGGILFGVAATIMSAVGWFANAYVFIKTVLAVGAINLKLALLSGAGLFIAPLGIIHGIGFLLGFWA